MPLGDKTGPLGKGPLTGRGLGPCGNGGKNIPISNMNGIPGRGRGGSGRGMGRGQGYGAGRRTR